MRERPSIERAAVTRTPNVATQRHFLFGETFDRLMQARCSAHLYRYVTPMRSIHPIKGWWCSFGSSVCHILEASLRRATDCDARRCCTLFYRGASCSVIYCCYAINKDRNTTYSGEEHVLVILDAWHSSRICPESLCSIRWLRPWPAWNTTVSGDTIFPEDSIERANCVTDYAERGAPLARGQAEYGSASRFHQISLGVTASQPTQRLNLTCFAGSALTRNGRCRHSYMRRPVDIKDRTDPAPLSRGAREVWTTNCSERRIGRNEDRPFAPRIFAPTATFMSATLAYLSANFRLFYRRSSILRRCAGLW